MTNHGNISLDPFRFKWMSYAVLPIASALILTCISLLRYVGETSPLFEVSRSGRGYPFLFLFNTTQNLIGGKLGYSINFVNSVVDLVIWWIVSLAAALLLVQIYWKRKRN